MDVSIGQAHYKGACYLYGKTGHFAYECSNQKVQIRAVLHTMTSEERQVQANKVRELDESNAKEEQLVKEALLKVDFVEA